MTSGAGPRAPLPVGGPLARPLAPGPTTPEAIIVQVRAQLAADAVGGLAPHAADLDRVAEAAVRRLWGGRVTAFVPILALRAAREALRALGPGGEETGTGPPRPVPTHALEPGPSPSR